MEKLIGLYWYCCDYYTGQWSWQYKVMCNSSYKPSPLATGILDESQEAIDYYNKLVARFES